MAGEPACGALVDECRREYIRKTAANADIPAARHDTPATRALADRRRLLGPEHVDIATTLNHLGTVLWSRSEYTRAEQVQREALSIRRKPLGREHADVAQSLNHLALTLSYTPTNRAAAESLHREALAMRQKLLGEDHPLVLTALARYKEADSLLTHSYPVLQAEWGPQHRHTVAVLEYLVELYERRGDPHKAAEYRAKVAESRQSSTREHHHA